MHGVIRAVILMSGKSTPLPKKNTPPGQQRIVVMMKNLAFASLFWCFFYFGVGFCSFFFFFFPLGGWDKEKEETCLMLLPYEPFSLSKTLGKCC